MKLLNHKELEGVTAVLGGCFDPVHLGHLHIAKQIVSWSRVAKVLFVPNGNHHFKKGLVQLSFADRYSLVKEAIKGEERFGISNADKSGTGFTSDLMRNLKLDNPDTRFVFIIGSDNLDALPKWNDFPWLQQHVHFLVLPRPGFVLNLEIVKQLKASLLPIELSPISSSEIRERIKRGDSIHNLVPEMLEEKIVKLYSAAKEK